MRALIVFESMYGNTRLVAEAIGRVRPVAFGCAEPAAPPKHGVSQNLPAVRTEAARMPPLIS